MNDENNFVNIDDIPTCEEMQKRIAKLEHDLNIMSREKNVRDAEMKLITKELEEDNKIRISTEKAFNTIVDKMNIRIENLEHTLEDLQQKPIKNNLFKPINP